MMISMGAERIFEKDLGASIYLEDDLRKHKWGNWESEARVEEELKKHALMSRLIIVEKWNSLNRCEKNASESLTEDRDAEPFIHRLTSPALLAAPFSSWESSPGAWESSEAEKRDPGSWCRKMSGQTSLLLLNSEGQGAMRRALTASATESKRTSETRKSHV